MRAQTTQTTTTQGLLTLGVVVGVVACAAAPPAGNGSNDVTIVDEEPPPALPEAQTPSTDPHITCLRVADRLATCTVERAKLVLGDLPADERAHAETVIQQAAEGIERLRGDCRAELADEDVAFVDAMGRCLPLECPALRSCVDQAK